MRRRMTCALGALALGFLTGEADAQPFIPVSRTTAVPTTVINIDSNDTGTGAAQVRPTTTTTTAPKTTVIDIDNFQKNFGDLQPRPIITNTTPKTTVIGTDSNDTGINIPKVRSITTETPKTTVIGIEGNEPAISIPQVRSITTSTPKTTIVSTGDDKTPKVETLTAPMLVQEPHDGFFAKPRNNHEQNCKWHWEVGGGVYYVQPFFHTNPAFLRFKATGLSLSTQQSDFRYNMQVAPLGWIAYVSDAGWGIRGRYFQFDQGAHEKFTGDGTSFVSSVPTNGGVGSVFAGAPGDVVNFSSRLRVEVWDLEGTYTFTSCRWNFMAAAGVRYANMFQSYDAKATPAGAAPATSTSSVSSFNGAGPTFALESKYRFGESGFAVYGTARGSVLFGPGRLTAGSTTNIGGNLLATQSFESHQADILPIGEAEVGLEFGRSVGKVRVFAQTGFVGQVWFGGGNAASTGVGGHSFSNDTNFGFVGVSGRIGINF